MGLVILSLAATFSSGSNIAGCTLCKSLQGWRRTSVGGLCPSRHVVMAHVALCHTVVTGKGTEMFPKCGLKMMPFGLEKVGGETAAF